MSEQKCKARHPRGWMMRCVAGFAGHMLAACRWPLGGADPDLRRYVTKVSVFAKPSWERRLSHPARAESLGSSSTVERVEKAWLR